MGRSRSQKAKLVERLRRSKLGSEDHAVRAETAWQNMLADPEQEANLSKVSEEDLEKLHQQVIDPNSDITKILGQMTKEEVVSLVSGLDDAPAEPGSDFRIIDPPYQKD